jgi:hypothetical protein
MTASTEKIRRFSIAVRLHGRVAATELLILLARDRGKAHTGHDEQRQRRE